MDFSLVCCLLFLVGSIAADHAQQKKVHSTHMAQKRRFVKYPIVVAHHGKHVYPGVQVVARAGDAKPKIKNRHQLVWRAPYPKFVMTRFGGVVPLKAAPEQYIHQKKPKVHVAKRLGNKQTISVSRRSGLETAEKKPVKLPSIKLLSSDDVNKLSEQNAKKYLLQLGNLDDITQVIQKFRSRFHHLPANFRDETKNSYSIGERDSNVWLYITPKDPCEGNPNCSCSEVQTTEVPQRTAEPTSGGTSVQPGSTTEPGEEQTVKTVTPTKPGGSSVAPGETTAPSTEIETEGTTVEPTEREGSTSEPTSTGTETKPELTETEPPSTETEPSSTETEPPSTETEPSATETEPPSTESEPSSTETEPPSTETELSIETETEPQSFETEPPSTETELPSVETELPSTETESEFTETEPPSTETEWPGESTEEPAVTTESNETTEVTEEPTSTGAGEVTTPETSTTEKPTVKPLPPHTVKVCLVMDKNMIFDLGRFIKEHRDSIKHVSKE